MFIAAGRSDSSRHQVFSKGRGLEAKHDPRSHTGIIVPFLKRAESPADAHAASLEAAKEWIEEDMV